MVVSAGASVRLAGFPCTTTGTARWRPPPVTVTVMCAVPAGPGERTRPVTETVAIAVLLDWKDTLTPVIKALSLSRTATDSCALSPRYKKKESGETASTTGVGSVVFELHARARVMVRITQPRNQVPL